MSEQNAPHKDHRDAVEPWRVERMEQRVPGHIDEPRILSPWILIGGIVLLIVVGCGLLFISSSGLFQNVTASSTTPTPALPNTTETPAATDAVTPSLAPTAAPTLGATRYTVKKGDTLSSIAQKFKIGVEAIRTANNLSGDTIREGDILLIPLPTPTPPVPPKTTPTPLAFGTPTLIAFIPTDTPMVSLTPTPTPGFVAYTVKSGDTLIQIAATFSTTVQSIMDMNGLPSANIRAGQLLTVPFGVWTPTATPTQFSIPTSTPTLAFDYIAPLLNWPPDGKEFASTDNVQLSWLSVGTLGSDEQYVLNLKFTCGDKVYRYAAATTQGTAYQLLNKGGCPATGQVEVAWYVVVVRQGGCPGKSGTNQPCAVSPVSETRTFIWD